MVGPARKREAVVHVCQRLEASERRACRTLGQARSSQRYKAKPKEDDTRLTAVIRRIAARETRAGYRGVRRHLAREGWDVNLKRVHRIWKKEGLRVPPKARKKRRLGNSENGTQRLAAKRINHVWSYDFVFDQTESGGRLKWLPVLDEFTRECLSLEVERSMTSGDVIETLERLVTQRGVPEFIRSDNGPEFVANAVKDWIAQKGFKTLFIEPGSPWQNCYSESFNARFRDEFLNVESFASLLEAKVLGEEHRDKYNRRRPHSSLGDLTPAEFAATCLTQPGCSQAPSASDEFRTHSQLPEPVNNPCSSGLVKSHPASDSGARKTLSPRPNKLKPHHQLS
jgi:transposase InsO family protein